MNISKRDFSGEAINRMKSEHIRNVLQCAYAAEITLVNGKRKTALFAMTTPDLYAFFGYLKQRAPDVEVRYR